MQIQGAIFDMDGTLVDSLGSWDDFIKFFEDKYSLKFDHDHNADLLRQFRTIPINEVAEIVHKKFGIGDSAETIANELFERLELFYRTKVKCKEDIPEFLQGLSEKGVSMCIASATNPELIRVVLKRCGIERYFSEIVSCEDVGKNKSFPDVFFAALERLGTKKEETWVFEDSITALKTAKNAGFSTVGVFDRNNDMQELVAAYSDEYIAEGESICRLL